MASGRVSGATQSRTGGKKSFVSTSVLFVGALMVVVVTGGCKSSPPPPAEAPAASSFVAKAPAKPAAVPYTKKHIYSETADPRTEIAAALKQAKREHKRVILDFGGDWCGDCQVLDIYFHQSPNEELLAKDFILTHVFIGQMDKNLDLAAHYGVPIEKGVPALAVIDANGKVLHSQQTGEFNDMRHMDIQSVTDFLNRWKA